MEKSVQLQAPRKQLTVTKGWATEPVTTCLQSMLWDPQPCSRTLCLYPHINPCNKDHICWTQSPSHRMGHLVINEDPSALEKNIIQKGRQSIFCVGLELIHSAVPHLVQITVTCWQRHLQSPGFIQWRPRCMNASNVSYVSSPLSLYWQPLQIFPVKAQVPLVDERSLVWPIHHPFHFHQFPCVQAPIPVGSCYVLPVLPGTDGSPRLIWILSEGS